MTVLVLDPLKSDVSSTVVPDSEKYADQEDEIDEHLTAKELEMV